MSDEQGGILSTVGGGIWDLLGGFAKTAVIPPLELGYHLAADPVKEIVESGFNPQTIGEELTGVNNIERLLKSFGSALEDQYTRTMPNLTANAVNRYVTRQRLTGHAIPDTQDVLNTTKAVASAIPVVGPDLADSKSAMEATGKVIGLATPIPGAAVGKTAEFFGPKLSKGLRGIRKAAEVSREFPDEVATRGLKSGSRATLTAEATLMELPLMGDSLKNKRVAAERFAEAEARKFVDEIAGAPGTATTVGTDVRTTFDGIQDAGRRKLESTWDNVAMQYAGEPVNLNPVKNIVDDLDSQFKRRAGTGGGALGQEFELLRDGFKTIGPDGKPQYNQLNTFGDLYENLKGVRELLRKAKREGDVTVGAFKKLESAIDDELTRVARETDGGVAWTDAHEVTKRFHDKFRQTTVKLIMDSPDPAKVSSYLATAPVEHLTEIRGMLPEAVWNRARGQVLRDVMDKAIKDSVIDPGAIRLDAKNIRGQLRKLRPETQNTLWSAAELKDLNGVLDLIDRADPRGTNLAPFVERVLAMQGIRAAGTAAGLTSVAYNPAGTAAAVAAGGLGARALTEILARPRLTRQFNQWAKRAGAGDMLNPASWTGTLKRDFLVIFNEALDHAREEQVRQSLPDTGSIGVTDPFAGIESGASGSPAADTDDPFAGLGTTPTP